MATLNQLKMRLAAKQAKISKLTAQLKVDKEQLVALKEEEKAAKTAAEPVKQKTKPAAKKALNKRCNMAKCKNSKKK